MLAGKIADLFGAGDRRHSKILDLGRIELAQKIDSGLFERLNKLMGNKCIGRTISDKLSNLVVHIIGADNPLHRRAGLGSQFGA